MNHRLCAQGPWLLLPLLCLAAGCFTVRSSSGGGQNVVFSGNRLINAADIAVPRGYAITAVAIGLNSPTGVCEDDQGQFYVTETNVDGDARVSRLARINSDGSTSVIAWGYNGPWDGVTFYHGDFYVAEAGDNAGGPIGDVKPAQTPPEAHQGAEPPTPYGRILKISRGGKKTPVISNLPSLGEYHVTGPIIGPEGDIYFGEGTATNSGIVGLDDQQLGWLDYNRTFHDFPAADVTLNGLNVQTTEPGSETEVTGAFSPFGVATAPGQQVPGQTPASGAVMRISPDGGLPELVAWGFRNPFGLGLDKDGQLFVTDQSYEDRGSRPVGGCGDLLWQVNPGQWYGWPDFHGQQALNSSWRFFAPGKPPPRPLFADEPGTPPAPTAELGMHADAAGIDCCRSADFGHADEFFVAEFGDLAPFSGKVLAPVGFDVIRVNPRNGVSHVFAANRSDATGPASKIGGGGLERPIAVRFDTSGTALYVVDYGVVTVADKPVTFPHTGVLWKITREGVP